MPERQIEASRIFLPVVSSRHALEGYKCAPCREKIHSATLAMLLSEGGNYSDMITASELDIQGSESRGDQQRRIASLNSTASSESMKSGQIAGCPMSYTTEAISGSIARRVDLLCGARRISLSNWLRRFASRMSARLRRTRVSPQRDRITLNDNRGCDFAETRPAWRTAKADLNIVLEGGGRGSQMALNEAVVVTVTGRNPVAGERPWRLATPAMSAERAEGRYKLNSISQCPVCRGPMRSSRHDIGSSMNGTTKLEIRSKRR